MHKRDAVVLVVVCGFALLSAGSLQLGGSRAAKVQMCATNLVKIGQAMAFYTGEFDGSLPLLEYYARFPSSTNTNPYVPAIDSDYLISKRLNGAHSQDGPPAYRHLGCLYGAGYAGDGELLFCPAVPGWRSGATTSPQNNDGTYLGAVSYSTGKFADLSVSTNQGWKATKGYCYWPLSRRLATQTDLDGIDSTSARTRYKLGLPVSATKVDDLDPDRPLVTDSKFHRDSNGAWTLNCLHPDGHVSYQAQPKADGLNGYGAAGTWGMHSQYEYCQFSLDICDGTHIISEVDKAANLGTGVTPTEFAYALQP